MNCPEYLEKISRYIFSHIVKPYFNGKSLNMVQILTCRECCDLLLEKCFDLTQKFKTLASNNFAVVDVLHSVIVVAPWDQAPDQSVYDISPDRLGLKKKYTLTVGLRLKK